LNWRITLIKEKNQKNEDQIEKKTTKNLIEWWNWKEKNFNKNVKDKIRNLKNKGRNEKSSMWENCYWMTKLKRIKISINEKGTK